MPDLSTEAFQRCCVATPATIADAMVQALGDGPALQWLEPCVGGGALVKAMRRAGVCKQRIRGVDLNPVADAGDALANVMRGVEFLSWAAKTSERFDRVVANPPYIPLARAPQAARGAALSIEFRQVRFDRRANCWAAFLVASIRLLRSGGSLAFLLPAAWEYAAYAEKLRRRIGRWFSTVRVVRTQEPMCDGVSDASVVLLAVGYAQSREGVSRVVVRDRDEAVACIRESTPSNALTRYSRPRSRGVQLGDVLRIRIGTVAGDAKVFLLSETQRLAFLLPEQSLRPVLSRSRLAMLPWITKEVWRRYRDDGERIWLFAPSGSDLDDVNVRAYIREMSKAVNLNGYKLSRRNEWYAIPAAPPADVLLSGMSRVGPILCLNRMRGLSATNTLYVGEFSHSATLDVRAGWALSLLSSSGRRGLARVARHYPDGLVKLEPGDLMRIKVPRPPARPGALEAYGRAFQTLREVGVAAAARLADAWLAGD